MRERGRELLQEIGSRAANAARTALQNLGPKKRSVAVAASALLLAVPLVAQVWEPGDPLPGPMNNREDGLDIPADDAVPSLPATTSPGFRLPGAEPRVIYPVPAETSSPRQVPDAAPDISTSAPPVPAAKPAETEAEQAADNDPEDFLCSRAPAGKVVPVPSPFDQWLVLVCTQDGQALVPVEGEAWVVRGSADIVSLFALPPGAEAPRRGAGFDARYDIRFETISGGEAAGDRKDRAISLLRLATNQNEPLPEIRDIWQLDAASNMNDTRYNIFFYRTGERPTRIIVCLERCMKALHLEVLTGAEAREVLGR